MFMEQSYSTIAVGGEAWSNCKSLFYRIAEGLFKPRTILVKHKNYDVNNTQISHKFGERVRVQSSADIKKIINDKALFNEILLAEKEQVDQAYREFLLMLNERAYLK